MNGWDREPFKSFIEERLDIQSMRREWARMIDTKRGTLLAGKWPPTTFANIGDELHKRISNLLFLEPLAAPLWPIPWESYERFSAIGMTEQSMGSIGPHPLWPGLHRIVDGEPVFSQYGTYPELGRKIDRLTSLASDKLVGWMANIPLDQRLMGIDTTDLCEVGCLEGFFNLGMPDLIVGENLVEIKCSQDVKLPLSWVRQIAFYVLMDRYDKYKIRKVAWYLGWHGVIVSWSVNQLLNVTDMHDLTALRESFRRVRGDEEERILSARLDGDSLAIAGALYTRVHQQIIKRSRPRGSVSRWTTPSPDDKCFANKMTNDQSALTDALDAIRGWRLACDWSVDLPVDVNTSLDALLDHNLMGRLCSLVRGTETYHGERRCAFASGSFKRRDPLEAIQTSTDTRKITAWSQHPDRQIRNAVAGNKHAPVWVLMRLRKDTDLGVAASAKSVMKCKCDELRQRRTESLRVNRLLAATNDPSTPAEKWWTMSRDTSEVVISAARNSELCPPEVLRQLLGESSLVNMMQSICKLECLSCRHHQNHYAPIRCPNGEQR